MAAREETTTQSNGDYIDVHTRIHLQREESRQSSFERYFPLIIVFGIIAILALPVISSSGDRTPINIHNNIEVPR